MEIVEKDTKIVYINTKVENASQLFSLAFCQHLKLKMKKKENIIILCIGTDRITGDSLGPLIGHKLSESSVFFDENIKIYGTLENPVHAKNLQETIDLITLKHKNSLIIAIDASLGNTEKIGYITLGIGPVCPGKGVKKSLPKVGDIFITGIVNYSTETDIFILQNTRLSTVMKIADTVCLGLIEGLKLFRQAVLR